MAATARWMDADTEFRLETKANGQLTGRVICCDCGARDHHIEAIDHEPDCANV